MKPRDLRELSADELASKIRETSREVANLRLKNRSGVAVEKAVQIRYLRRDVARMQTIAAERESLS